MKLFENLPGKRYDIIYADLPWDYGGRTQHAGVGVSNTGSARAHYRTMKSPQLESFPINQIANDDCLLFMWATSPLLHHAVALGLAWNFQWVTVAFVWDKQITNPGYYTLSQCEQVLLFKRGKIPQPRGTRNERQLVSEKRREHSRKPEEVRTRIERMFPTQQKIELFAREHHDGWDSWGDQLPNRK